MLQVKNIAKSFASKAVLKGIDFDLPAGQVLTVLGPNGAGKSTLIKCILGLTPTDQGEVSYRGKKIGGQRQLMGCTPQDSEFPKTLKVKEVLQLVASRYPNSQPIEVLLKHLELEKLANQNCGTLSGGQRRCLGLACAFVGQPEIVFLDEPTVGLDVEVRAKLWNYVHGFVKAGGSVLLTTHYLQEAEELSDRVVIVDQGKVIKNTTVSDLKAELGYKKVSFRCTESAIAQRSDLQAGVDHSFSVVSKDSDTLVKDLMGQYNIFDLEVVPINLEEAFLMMLNSQSSNPGEQ